MSDLIIVLMLILRIPTMTEDVARNALVSFVNSKCCYGNKAAGELVIQDLRQLTLYRVSISISDTYWDISGSVTCISDTGL